MFKLKQISVVALIAMGVAQLSYAQGQSAVETPTQAVSAVKPAVKTATEKQAEKTENSSKAKSVTKKSTPAKHKQNSKVANKAQKGLASSHHKSAMLGAAQKQPFTSAAQSYGSLSTSVNPRTGSMNLSFPLGGFSSHGLAQKDFSLSIAYSQQPVSPDNPYYVADHWVYELPMVQNGTLSVAGGEHYIDGTSSAVVSKADMFPYKPKTSAPHYSINLRYSQFLGAKIVTTNQMTDNSQVLDNLTVVTKTGSVETFKKYGENDGGEMVLSQILYPTGYTITFNYSKETGKLASVTDSLGNALTTTGQVSGSGLVWTRTLISAGNAKVPVTQQVTLAGHSFQEHTQLDKITMSGTGISVNQEQTAEFSYYDNGVAEGLLKTISSPSTQSQSVIRYGALPYALVGRSNNDPSYLPAVSSVCALAPNSAAGQDQTATITSYLYGQYKTDSVEDANLCKPMTRLFPDEMSVVFTGNNYTGYSLGYAPGFDANASGSASMFGYNGSNAGKQNYAYNVTIQRSAEQNGVALPAANESSVQTYDRLQRLDYQTTTQGDHIAVKAVVYHNMSATDLATSGAAILNLGSASVAYNMAHTQYNGDQPASQTYDLPKVTATQITVGTALTKRTYSPGFSQVWYNNYGEPQQQVSPTGVTKQTHYSLKYEYAGVPSIPDWTATYVPGIGTTTTVNTITPTTANTLTNSGGTLVNTGKVTYYPVTETQQYFAPKTMSVSGMLQQGIDIKGWWNTVKDEPNYIVGSGALGTAGFLISQTTSNYGGFDPKTSSGSLGVYNYKDLPYLLSKTVTLPAGTPYDPQQLKVMDNLGKSLTSGQFAPHNSAKISYQYGEEPGKYWVTTDTHTTLSPGANAPMRHIKSTVYFDAASGLKLETKTPFHIHGSTDGFMMTLFGYNGLGQLTSRITMAKPGSMGMAYTVGDMSYQTTYADVPTSDDIIKTKTNKLTGYIKVSNNNVVNMTKSEYDNAYCVKTSTDNCSGSNAFKELSETQYNILGQKVSSTSSYTPATGSGAKVLTETYAYNNEGQMVTKTSPLGIQSKAIVDPIVTDPSLSSGSWEGNQVSLAGSYAQYGSGANVHIPELQIKETSLKTGKTLASYTVNQPLSLSNDVCAGLTGDVTSGALPIAQKCLEAVVMGSGSMMGKTAYGQPAALYQAHYYTTKTTTVYNRAGKPIEETGVSPTAYWTAGEPVSLSSGDITSTSVRYNALGKAIEAIGPKGPVTNSKGVTTDKNITLYTEYGITGKPICKAMSDDGVNACNTTTPYKD